MKIWRWWAMSAGLGVLAGACSQQSPPEASTPPAPASAPAIDGRGGGEESTQHSDAPAEATPSARRAMPTPLPASSVGADPQGARGGSGVPKGTSTLGERSSEMAPPAPEERPLDRSLGGPGESDGSGRARRRPAPRAARAQTSPRPAPAEKKAAPLERADEESKEGESGAPARAEALARDLDRAERRSTPNCEAARERERSICTLATQLCELGQREGESATLGDYCVDARERCTRARGLVRARCEPTP